jgi:hypothetical protein
MKERDIVNLEIPCGAPNATPAIQAVYHNVTDQALALDEQGRPDRLHMQTV